MKTATCEGGRKLVSELVAGQDLNLRPLGYEPNELPDCSQRRSSRHGRAAEENPIPQRGQFFSRRSLTAGELWRRSRTLATNTTARAPYRSAATAPYLL